MIGDNPKADIGGANAKGWVSILVKTGIFDSNDARNSVNGNDREHPATHVVENFQAAIELIYKLENLTLEWSERCFEAVFKTAQTIIWF